MRAIKLAAAAFVLGGISVPALAQISPVFDNRGSCNSYLNQARKAAAQSGDSFEAARWNAAFCKPVAFQRFIIIFPI